MYANSALAGNTFVRSLAGGGFPMFAAAMYHNLGEDWATSLLGFLAVAFLPCPVLFFLYGKKVRGGVSIVRRCEGGAAHVVEGRERGEGK